MAGAWKALAFPDVSESALRQGFRSEGVGFDAALHITATASLAGAMRRRGIRAIQMSDVINLVVRAGVRSPYPRLGGSDEAAFLEQRASWAREIGTRNFDLSVKASKFLRGRLRDAPVDTATAQNLRRSVRAMRRAILNMAANGLHPSDFAAAASPTLRELVAAWEALERHLPELFQLRDDLWFDSEDYAAASSPAGRDLRDRVERSLADLTEVSAPGPFLVAYHGFYFYTPPQWAWFQLLRGHPEVNQYFVVHDDGENPAYETWRRYFTGHLRMPIPELVGAVDSPAGPAGLRLVAALQGKPVPSDLGDLRIARYGSPAAFVSAWQDQRIAARLAGRARPRLFAADAEEIDRLVRRFGIDDGDGAVDLSQTPIGYFLIALHDCVVTDEPPKITLTAERLIDMVASGCLDAAGGLRPSQHLGAIRRAMPYFDGLEALDDWLLRASELRTLVDEGPGGLPKRRQLAAETDVTRMRRALENPFRLVPWLDITLADVDVLLSIIARIGALARSLAAATDAVRYLKDVRPSLVAAMGDLPRSAREEIARKLASFAGLPGAGVGLDADGVKEVVQIILGRKAALGADGHSDADDLLPGGEGRARLPELRNLDALAFERPENEVHIANLGDDKFPRRVDPYPWPFDRDAVAGCGREMPYAILRMREENAELGDLYLFWVALASPRPTATLTLSWIGEDGAELRNPSPLLSLLSALESRPEQHALRTAVGGLMIDRAVLAEPPLGDQELQEPTRAWDRTDGATASIRANSESFDLIAVSTALSCPRRFALQWALGPTGSFSSPHHHSMLLGNLENALERQPWGWRFADVRAYVERAWVQLSPAERNSSRRKRAVRGRGAHWKWIYFLGGSRPRADHEDTPIDEVYRHAIARPPKPVPHEAVAPSSSDALPAGVNDPAVCVHCPVRFRCADASFEDA